MSEAAAAKTAALLKMMWEKNLPMLRERVALLERAVTDEAVRGEAAGVAHKLAGSLGMFGHPEGTRIARELEVALGEGQDSRLSELVRMLRESLPL